MPEIHFYGAKGGVGTSTAAAITALTACRQGYDTKLWVSGTGDAGDLAAILGRPEPVELPISLAAITGIAPTIDEEFNVTDWGTMAPNESEGDTQRGDLVVMVLRNCYLSLRRALGSGCRPDRALLVTEPGRPLGLRDVRDVLNLPISVFERTESLARNIDAGLLAYRLNRLPDLGLCLPTLEAA